MGTRTQVKVLLACGALAVALAGCGDDDGADTGAATKPASSTKTEGLTGTYTAKFSGRETGPDGPGPEPGLWALHVNPPAMQAAYAGKTGSFGFAVSEGVPVKVAGRTLAFGPTRLCNGRGAGAKYTYSTAAGTLNFKKLNDDCTERVLFLTTHPWTRVSGDPEAGVD